MWRSRGGAVEVTVNDLIGVAETEEAHQIQQYHLEKRSLYAQQASKEPSGYLKPAQPMISSVTPQYKAEATNQIGRAHV